jgi:hypothetical protein
MLQPVAQQRREAASGPGDVGYLPPGHVIDIVFADHFS